MGIGNKRHGRVPEGVSLEWTPEKGVRSSAYNQEEEGERRAWGSKGQGTRGREQKVDNHSQDIMMDKTKLECSERRKRGKYKE